MSSFKYSLEGVNPPEIPTIVPYSPKTVVEDKNLFKAYVYLANELDEAEQVYDRHSKLKMKSNKDDKDFWFRERIYRANSVYFLYLGEVVVGMMLTMRSEYDKAFFISSLVVNKAYRGKGYGTMLINYAKEKHAGETALLRVSDGNVGGQALYKKLGFKPLSHVLFCEPGK